MSPVRIGRVVGNPRPQSRTHGLARVLAHELALTLPGAMDTEVDLAALGPRVLDQADPGAAAAVREVPGADMLVVASPTCKATYSGLLKCFLDRFAAGSLAGKAAVPILLGGAPSHQLAVNVHFLPLPLEPGAEVPAGGLFVLESGIHHFGVFTADWAATHAPALAARNTVSNRTGPAGVSSSSAE